MRLHILASAVVAFGGIIPGASSCYADESYGDGGETVYDPENNVFWLRNANLAATPDGRGLFGLPRCPAGGASSAKDICVNGDGAMNYRTAEAWVRRLNSYVQNGVRGYLGHSDWTLPAVTPRLKGPCYALGLSGGFSFGCQNGAQNGQRYINAMGTLYYRELGPAGSGLAPLSAVQKPATDTFLRYFVNVQPNEYWTDRHDTRIEDIKNGYITFSFLNGWQGSNIGSDDETDVHAANFMYVWPMFPGEATAIVGKLQSVLGGQAVYDPVSGATFLADANIAGDAQVVAELNARGDPKLRMSSCSGPKDPSPCIGPHGLMTWTSAKQFVALMNSYDEKDTDKPKWGWLGVHEWDLPPVVDSLEGCQGSACASDPPGDPLAYLFYGPDRFHGAPGTSAVTPPSAPVGPFLNLMSYYYWGCSDPHNTAVCPNPQEKFPASEGDGEFSFNFNTGYMSTDLVENELFVTAYYPSPRQNGR